MYHDKTKYLGVMLRSTVKFSVDLSYMKSNYIEPLTVYFIRLVNLEMS